MNLVEKVNSVCTKIDEKVELEYIFNSNEESIKISDFASDQVLIVIDILRNYDGYLNKEFLSVVEKYFESSEKILNWSRIDIFEVLIKLEKIKKEVNYKG